MCRVQVNTHNFSSYQYQISILDLGRRILIRFAEGSGRIQDILVSSLSMRPSLLLLIRMLKIISGFFRVGFFIGNLKQKRWISGHLETHLFDVDNSVETRKDLRDIELVCKTEMQGNTLLRDLHILVHLQVFISTPATSLFRNWPLSILTGVPVLRCSDPLMTAWVTVWVTT